MKIFQAAVLSLIGINSIVLSAEMKEEGTRSLKPRRSCTMVGDYAPRFCAPAVQQDKVKKLCLYDFKDAYKILFFYPKNFTYVCPTELLALQERLHDFERLGAIVLGISVDTIESHQQWLATPQEQGGIQGVTFFLLSDDTKKIARAYGILDEEEGIAQRAVFIIDKHNVIQAMVVTNAASGRSIDEILRLLDSLQVTEKSRHVCPANWKSGQETFEPTAEAVASYLRKKKREI